MSFGSNAQTDSGALTLARALSERREQALLVATPDGQTQTLIGKFDIGLDVGLLDNSEAVLEHVRRFINDQPSLFFDTKPPEAELANWALLITPRHEERTTFYDIVQTTEGVLWLDSQVIIQVDNSTGFLVSISGDLRTSKSALSLPDRSVNLRRQRLWG